MQSDTKKKNDDNQPENVATWPDVSLEHLQASAIVVFSTRGPATAHYSRYRRVYNFCAEKEIMNDGMMVLV